MTKMRVVVIGLGHAGTRYARMLADGCVPQAQLAAVCTRRRARARRLFGPIPCFSDPRALVSSGLADAVIVATPHAEHTPIGILALKAGLHVLMEKPLAATLADARRLVAAHRGRTFQVFGVMYNCRADPAYKFIKNLLDRGALGRIFRVHWTFTEWYRTQSYFRSSWRGTWAGEGGGLLVNQSIHHTDLLQWWLGRPASVWANAGWGKYHDIEVEDEVAACWKYRDGLMVTLVFSTGEVPGLNHLEIFGDRGTLVLDGAALSWCRFSSRLSRHTKKCSAPDQKPKWRQRDYVFPHCSTHLAAIQNFIEVALRCKKRLLAPATEGLAAVEIANAMQLSALEGREVRLPLDLWAYVAAMRRVPSRIRGDKDKRATGLR